MSDKAALTAPWEELKSDTRADAVRNTGKLAPVAKLARLERMIQRGQPGSKDYGVSHIAGPPNPDLEDRGR